MTLARHRRPGDVVGTRQPLHPGPYDAYVSCVYLL
jgi:hypothetical protein